MLSKTLLKLIDEAILPALVVVIGKILGIALLAPHFGVAFTLNLQTLPEDAAVSLNNYSNLIAYGGIALGMALILTRSYFFHGSHISPQVTIRLYRFSLTHIIATTYELFHQAIVWASYLWLLTFLFLVQAYWKLVPSKTAFGVLALTVVLSFFLFRDVDREIDLADLGKPN